MSSNYPVGVTGNEWQIAGPTIEQEKQGFIEDWLEEVKKIEKRFYEIAKEIDGELDEEYNSSFDSIFSGIDDLLSELRHKWEYLEGPDEYDDPRL